MSRKRQIDPIYPFEAEIRALSIPARYFYLLSWCYMSDPNKDKNIVGGVMPYDLFFLKNNIFPEENIDIASILNEIITQKRYFPFETNNKKWLWCPTMPKHQVICHPSGGKYPDPPIELQEQYKSGELALSQSRIEKNRIEKKKAQPYWAEYSKTCEEKLELIYKEFNIYQFLSKLHKDKKIKIPEEVIIRICDSYLKNKPEKTDWGWFVVVTQQEWERWNSEQNEKDSQERQRTAREPIAPAIAEIIRGMG